MLFTSEEKQSKKAAPEVKYPFWSGNPAVPRAFISAIINPMYAKLELFELELLPINELEMAASYLDASARRGFYTRSMFNSYALHLAQSMEKFAQYLWKLKGWSDEVVAHEEG